MSQPMNGPAISPSILTVLPSATLNVGMALMSRRSTAIADYWRSFAEVRQPAELMAVQLSYFSHMIDDYGEALAESVSQLSAPTAAAPPRIQAPPLPVLVA